MAGRGIEVVAINIQPVYNIQQWKTFWKSLGAGDVLWAQDTGYSAVAAYNVTALGTTIIIDRQGRITFRDSGGTSYDKLRTEVEKAL
jgi:PHP family Zn ribbon phosphoesterase